MKFTLLTHFKEFEKRSNTGRVVLDILAGDAEQLRWDRMNPPTRAMADRLEEGFLAFISQSGAKKVQRHVRSETMRVGIDGV